MTTVTRFAALAGLLTSTLAVVGLGAATQSANAVIVPESFTPRWCAAPATSHPCLESASHNGAPVTAADPNYSLQSTDRLTSGAGDYFMWQVVSNDGSPLPEADLGDTWSLLFDTGNTVPRYTEAYAGRQKVDRIADGDGTWHVRYTGKTVLTTDGCGGPTWPWTCTMNASAERVELSGEVHDKADLADRDSWDGFDRSQSADGVNGIFLETAPDGSRFLSSELVNSHFRVDGTTPFVGQVRFRLPYRMLKDEFGVPAPATMVDSSLFGSLQGSTSATWNISHDPAGGGMVVDIFDITFSRVQIEVHRGLIVPTKPSHLRAKRVTATRARLVFAAAKPRGARVTGYRVRCVNGAGNHVVKVVGDDSPIVVRGLHRGAAYSCKVRATSKAGPGPWSAIDRVPRRPR